MSVKLLRGTCSTCKRNKSLNVSDQTIQAEGLGDFFRGIGEFFQECRKENFKQSWKSITTRS